MIRTHRKPPIPPSTIRNHVVAPSRPAVVVRVGGVRAASVPPRMSSSLDSEVEDFMSHGASRPRTRRLSLARDIPRHHEVFGLASDMRTCASCTHFLLCMLVGHYVTMLHSATASMGHWSKAHIVLPALSAIAIYIQLDTLR